MAVFTVNHANDGYHGCPYGSCCAFTELPKASDMTPDPSNSHCFFRYNLAGFPGIGTNPIADPKTGEFGYESSPDGTFHVGPINTKTRQNKHDQNYPGFSLPEGWGKSLPFKSQPNKHPSCSRAGEPNKDPNPTGKVGGTSGKAASSSGRGGSTSGKGGSTSGKGGSTSGKGGSTSGKGSQSELGANPGNNRGGQQQRFRSQVGPQDQTYGKFSKR
ncbi:hypothetical protein O181_016978 [Austropuccinia psidii MF-1]|uniref:Uncharacterized protein n=1 Tax=Austropuccinia psidii MF-1 TaxID=1389203 RepID=A0A9Q3GRE1_9BASI|nr:hypothetical protein [Austropuccinia psidii MF-1]